MRHLGDRALKGVNRPHLLNACAQLYMELALFIHQLGSDSVSGLPDCVLEIYFLM